MVKFAAHPALGFLPSYATDGQWSVMGRRKEQRMGRGMTREDRIKEQWTKALLR